MKFESGLTVSEPRFENRYSENRERLIAIGPQISISVINVDSPYHKSQYSGELPFGELPFGELLFGELPFGLQAEF
jgi:hypothetical protein